MNKQKYIQEILPDRQTNLPLQELASAYAPSNIALCKYWGKRDAELNLPETSSLSISMADRGATTLIKLIDKPQDEIILGEHSIPVETTFARRLTGFLDLFRPQGYSFHVKTDSNIPVAAGLASSAAGFAALTSALNLLFDWQLTDQQLSLLARLGSGSACRSFWHGFVEWHRGQRCDGMDCFAEHLPQQWPELKVGLLITHDKEKPMSSRQAMAVTRATSRYYQLWTQQVVEDLPGLKQAIAAKDFPALGLTAEQNALAMHAIMLTANPSILFCQPETVAAMHQVWALRQDGVPVYFTQDAGPNLKLLFLEQSIPVIQQSFEQVEIISPF